jgi:hypothetical protein
MTLYLMNPLQDEHGQSVIQEIPHLSRNLKLHYLAPKGSSLPAILSET